MVKELFEKFIFLSKGVRKDYPKSLGTPSDKWEDVCHFIDFEIPVLFQTIYGRVSGTRRDIKHQQLMDFIPGYRLIHICELIEENNKFKSMYYNYTNIKLIPFLANYSSDFICYGKMNDGKEVIGIVTHDDNQFQIMHNSSEKFFETICAFYKENVYFLDTDGYLDYDFEKEGIIGAEINLNVDYWIE